MARMYPQTPDEGTESNAERKIFYALKDLLPDDYSVIHSLSVYQKVSKKGPLRDGEIDFLIIHPDKGMLAIEVKGGGVEIDSEAGEWFSTDYHGVRHQIKDPYEQSKKHIHTLSREIGNHEDLRRFSYPFGHAVWFPDLDLTNQGLGLSLELKNITMGKTDISRTLNAIPQMFRNAVGEKPRKAPTKNGVEKFIRFYAPSRKISITLSSKIENEKEAIFKATKSQYRVLSLIERFPRVSVSGAAGCGKTFIALEKARRVVEADSGKRVLFVCFNKALAQYLQKMNPNPSQIDIFHFHGLCTEFCKRAQLEIPTPDPQGDPKVFFRNELPDCLLDSLEELDDRYDALIVDEGQDFQTNWWIPLQELLTDPEEGMFYIFFDDNQKIYSKDLELPFGDPPLSLNENCRNTQLINCEAMKYYKGLIKPSAIGPKGREPQVVRLNESITEEKCVDSIIIDLLKEEQILPENITILTPRKNGLSIWSSNTILAKHRITWDITKRRDSKIFCSTIHSFKGLESSVVIVTELADIIPTQRDELMYIAATRANSHLIIVN